MPAMVLPPAYNSRQGQEQQDTDEYLSQEPVYDLYRSLPRDMTGFEARLLHAA